MREILFRAWDKDNEQMIYPMPIGELTVGDILNRRSILMQYTGLKDKNGSDIYESDIIKDTLTGAIILICFGFNKYVGYTGWYGKYLNIDRNGFCAINNDSDSETNSMIELCGNIHEDPEFLS